MAVQRCSDAGGNCRKVDCVTAFVSFSISPEVVAHGGNHYAVYAALSLFSGLHGYLFTTGWVSGKPDCACISRKIGQGMITSYNYPLDCSAELFRPVPGIEERTHIC